MNDAALQLYHEQLRTWKTAYVNYQALSLVQTREISVNDICYRIQYNAARIVSSDAKVDAASIARRPCFLCASHRPIEQKSIPLLGHYELLVNPYPIFPEHFTLVEKAHVPQRIAPRMADMLQLAYLLSHYTVFYNGPCCGASAPDHAHFQAGTRGFLPIEDVWRQQIDKELAKMAGATLYCLADTPRATLVIEADQVEAASRMFHMVYQALPVLQGEVEPRMNILTLFQNGHWEIFIFPRSKHRPACYSAVGKARLLSSPASVDLGGVFVLPREEDFRKITAPDITQILSEVCLPLTELKMK